MAVRFMEGFDNTSAEDLYSLYGFTFSSPAPYAVGRFGTGTSRRTAWATPWSFVTPAELPATMIAVFAHFQSEASRNIIQFNDGGTIQVLVRVVQSGTDLIVRVFRNATQLGSDYTVVGGFNNWHHYQIKATIHSTSGYVEIRMDGVPAPVFTFTGNTQATANAYITNVSSTWEIGPQALYDDIVILDTAGPVNNDFPGEVMVVRFLPNGAGQYAEWTPSAGNNYACVDDPTGSNADTDYVASGTAGQKDSYNIPDLAGTPSIYAVQPAFSIRKDDGAFRTARIILRSGGTDYPGETRVASSSYTIFKDAILENDPATSAPWTYTALNALQIGVELVS